MGYGAMREFWGESVDEFVTKSIPKIEKKPTKKWRNWRNWNETTIRHNFLTLAQCSALHIKLPQKGDPD